MGADNKPNPENSIFLFYGRYQLRMGRDGRLKLPARFLTELAKSKQSNEVMLLHPSLETQADDRVDQPDLFEFSGCLTGLILPHETWLELERSVMNLEDAGLRHLVFRHLLQTAERISVDSRGRIKLPLLFRTVLKIKAQVEIIGGSNLLRVAVPQSISPVTE